MLPRHALSHHPGLSAVVPCLPFSNSPPPLHHGSPFFFNDPATTETYTLSLHDALPILRRGVGAGGSRRVGPGRRGGGGADRKSTRLNSSHVEISYAVFCLKKKSVSIYGPGVVE